MFEFKIFVVIFSISSIHGFTASRDVAAERSGRDVCDIICDDVFVDDRVCGTDGVEYKSRCEYDKAACVARQSGPSLHIVNKGPCITFNSSCVDVAATQCYSPRTKNESELMCGSDGHTYATECFFMHSKCQRLALGKDLRIVRNGSCETVNGTDTIDCTPYVVDVSGLALESGSDTIIMLSCQKHLHQPICTIGGYTYDSECSFCSYLDRARKLMKAPELGSSFRIRNSVVVVLVGQMFRMPK